MCFINPNTKDLQVGDLIVAWKKGFHIVTKIEHRYVTIYDRQFKLGDELIKTGDELEALISYKQIADSNGVAVEGEKEYHCSVSFCSKVDKQYLQKKIEGFRNLIKRLETFKGETK